MTRVLSQRAFGPAVPCVQRRRLISTTSWAAMAVAVSVLSYAASGPAFADTTTPGTAQTPSSALPFIANPVTGQNESIVQRSSSNAVLTDAGYQILQVTKVNDTFVPMGSSDTYTVTGVTTVKDAKGNDQVVSVQAMNNTTSAVSSFDIADHIIPTSVLNPETEEMETVQKVASLSMVLTRSPTTNAIHMILLPMAQNDKVYVPSATPGVPNVFTVANVHTDSTTGRVISLDLKDSNGDPLPDAVTRVNDGTAAYAGLPNPQNGSGASGVTNPTITIPPGDVSIIRRGTGNNGDNGKDGGGFEICFGIFGCIDIAYHPTSGDPGAPGPNYTLTVTQASVHAVSPPDTYLHTATSGTPPTPGPPPDPGNPGMPGILLVSVGGTGGQGGDAYGNIDAAPGGTAGVGGNIWLENDVDITTTGISSHGIYAKSSAGQGGEGGSGYIFSGGGFGGSAAQAGTVTIKNFGKITTGGDYAIGIQAQSLGGRAGDGGDSYGFVGNGGGGSSGGNGSTVIVENDKEIDTGGAFAHGILAQSIGGSGGNGGESGGLVSYGDTGGAGGNGGDVTVTNFGVIKTFGASARGIFAESIGGGGGTGGDSSGLAAVGGKGGPGSFGGTVTVGNSGSITTIGNKSIGIFAQSVGGGGGDGGSSSGPLLSVGGDGESGGDGGVVNVNNTGIIKTSGDDAHGVFAQSVGGGGGNGGSSDSVSAFGGIALGGKGGAGGVGGVVDITFDNRTQTGVILTAGDRSRGIFAQSVGGGGGAGGVAKQLSVGLAGAMSLAIGGRGGDGGKGGVVNVGNVSTQCLLLPSACYSQVHNDLFIQTQGDNAEGMYVQSVGGGGGAGGYAIAAAVSAGVGASVSMSTSVGGSGGGGGAGGDVTIRTGGVIQTGTLGGAFVTVHGVQTTEVRNSGEFSTGLMAQSVGGGGGKGGFSISASVAAAVGGAISMATGVGGSGGSGGDAGKVDVDFDGSITTYGDDAAGAIIQSVGGGGGTGGYNISASIAAGAAVGAAASVGVGGSGGTAGAGGQAKGTIAGDVFTVGARSTGVLVQSVGGGGGDGGFNISGSLGLGWGVGAGRCVGVGGQGA